MRAGPPATVPAPRLLSRTTGKLGAPVAVPAVGTDEILLTRIEMRETLSGRLRSFLYKPAAVTIDVQTSDGSVRHRRLIPAMARSPFISRP